MKRIISAVMIVSVCIALVGCSLPFGKEEPKEQPKKEKKTQEQIAAPYVGYAPLDKTTEKVLSAVSESFPEGSSLEVLKYEAGDNNKAIIRMEKYAKGGWETTQEQSLLLIHNVRNGYIIFNGDKDAGITINTDSIKQNDKEVKNTVHFKAEKYAVSQMFEKPKDSEGRMDLTEKKVLMMGFGKEPIHMLNGNVVPITKGKPADIQDIYNNKNERFTDIDQDLYAVTIEFVYDELIPKMPYFNKGEKDISYVAGIYDTAEVKLQKLVVNEKTEKAEWETVGEPVSTPLKPTGKMKVSGSAKDGKYTVQIGDATADFSIPLDEDNKFVYEADGITEENMSAKGELVLKMAETGTSLFGKTEDEQTDLQSLITTAGATADEVYTDYREDLTENNYITVYALTISVK